MDWPSEQSRSSAKGKKAKVDNKNQMYQKSQIWVITCEGKNSSAAAHNVGQDSRKTSATVRCHASEILEYGLVSMKQENYFEFISRYVWEFLYETFPRLKFILGYDFWN